MNIKMKILIFLAKYQWVYTFIKLKSDFKIWLLSKLVILMFIIETTITAFKKVKSPDLDSSFIVAIWHAHQCGLYCFKGTIPKVNILISKSFDGQIITNACEYLGYKVIRGSKGKKGAVQSVFQMKEALDNNQIVAITVDGPKGPKHVVKPGVIELAKLSGKPIIPMVWYSKDKNFAKFKSWDEFRFPIGFCTTLSLFGEPIYVPNNPTKEEFEKCRIEVEQKLKSLYDDLKENYQEYLKSAK